MSAPTTAHAEKSKKQIAYEMLKDKIITNQLKPGTMLVERQLCEMLNSSRTPIREAIQQLSTDGLVTSIPAVGSYVSEVRYEYVIQLYDVREYLEGLAARLCAINITDSQIQTLNRYWLNMNDDIRTKEYDKLFQEDSNFHQGIVTYSRNEILQNLYTPLASQIFRITFLTEDRADGIIRSHDSHLKILQAITHHQAEEAENQMREHLRTSKMHHLKKMAPHLFDTTQNGGGQ